MPGKDTGYDPLVRVVLVVLGLLVAVVAARPAAAQSYPDGASFDLYNGAAIGNVRIIGMGGTAVATAQGSAGTLANPASAAVRSTTSKGSWDWDYHVDWLSSAGSDIDNNGQANDDRFGSSEYSIGLAAMLDGFGVAVVGTVQSTDLTGDSGSALEASVSTTKLAIAKELLDETWTVGAAMRIGGFSLRELDGRSLATNEGAGLEVGGLWRPSRADWRVGATVAFPISGRDLQTDCDPANCDGYSLPDGVAVPWQLAGGVAFRHVFDVVHAAPGVWDVVDGQAPAGAWNQHILTPYRDEHALLLAADVVVTGRVAQGYGIEAFASHIAQRSGEHAVVSVRAGAEYEWLPGRLRVRGGSYWEPGRFRNHGGRAHGTVGLELSILQFHLFRWTYRVRISATADLASRYANTGVSVGFWH
jgi:hypothetical protein